MWTSVKRTSLLSVSGYGVYRTAGLLLIACLLTIGCGNDQADDQSPSNWHRHNRSHNRLAYNHGRNLLDSCMPGAVLITQGDNDTFPLWYLQVVEGYRRDVCVVSLTLLNAPWYIRQLRDRPDGVPLDMTDEFIDRRLSGGPGGFGSLRWSPEPAPYTAAGITWNLPPDMIITEEIGLLTVAHYMLIRIIDTVDWSRPLYFSSAVAPEHFIGLDRNLSYEGLVYQLTHEPSPSGGFKINTEVLADNLLRQYQLSGIFGDEVYRSNDTERILNVYFEAYLTLMAMQVAKGDTAETWQSLRMLKMLAQNIPERERLLADMIEEFGDSSLE